MVCTVFAPRSLHEFCVSREGYYLSEYLFKTNENFSPHRCQPAKNSLKQYLLTSNSIKMMLNKHFRLFIYYLDFFLILEDDYPKNLKFFVLSMFFCSKTESYTYDVGYTDDAG
jgi:hypothetical protein